MSDKKKIVVIGGSAAGPKTAAKARRLDENAEITIIQKGVDLSMASCGYPYYVGGFFDNRNKLLCTPTGVVRSPGFFLNAKNIIAKTETEVIKILKDEHKVVCRDLNTEKEFELEYDKLVIATGSVPKIPPVPGTELDGITTLQSMRDADYLRKIRDEKKIKEAVVIGGGLIGIETCEALNLAGIKITVIELLPQILMFLDLELSKLMERHIIEKSSDVITSDPVSEFIGENGKLKAVRLKSGKEIKCELAVIAAGVSPNTKLAEETGIKLGKYRGVEVNEYMKTSVKDIYAVGDCVEIINKITGKKTLAPYGDLANLEGRIAGENIIEGNKVKFPGTINTGICKVFDYSAGATGLSERKAKEEGYDVVTVIKAGPDKPGFMGGLLLITKMVADIKTGKLLGMQCVGPGDVSKQIASAAVAIQGGLTIDDIVNLDLPYAPPFSLAIDNFISTAHVLQNKMKGRMKGIDPIELKKKLDNKENIFLLDLRGKDEYEQMRFGFGEKLIPLGTLRQRLNELPENKDAEIITYCKISLRGYEGARILESNGWKNVKVLEGGIVAWPYDKEK